MENEPLSQLQPHELSERALKYDEASRQILEATMLELAADQGSHAEMTQIRRVDPVARGSFVACYHQFERFASARVLAHREKMERKRQERASGKSCGQRMLPYVHGGYGMTFRNKAQWAKDRRLHLKGRR